eukprot:3873857-Lingulodinium_polyedra.AAC.1
MSARAPRPGSSYRSYGPQPCRSCEEPPALPLIRNRFLLLVFLVPYPGVSIGRPQSEAAAFAAERRQANGNC